MEKLFEEMMQGFTGSAEAKTALLKRLGEMFAESVETSASEKLDALKEA